MVKYRQKIILFLITLSLVFTPLLESKKPIDLSVQQIPFPLPSTHPMISKAISFLKNQQSNDGSIGGLTISPWVSMAFASVNDKSASFDRLTQYLLQSIDSLNESGKATDWQRHILGITARNNSLIQTKKSYFTEKLWSLYNDQQFGKIGNIYDDFFGLFALTSLTNNSLNQTIRINLRSTILEKQQGNGGWNDVDTTSMAIMALRITGLPEESPALKEAYSYLMDKLDISGGFTSWGSVNTASTSWAISALTTLNKTANQLIWNATPFSPLEFLMDMQQPDGSFNYTNSTNLNPIWMTAYAIIALRGQSFPITVLHSLNNQTQNENNDNQNQNEKNIFNSNESYPNQKDNPSSHPYFYVHSPNINGIYFNDKFIHSSIKKPLIIRSTNVTVRTNASIDRVLFYINNDIYHIDTTKPFSCRLKSNQFLSHIKLTVHGITIQKNITTQNLMQWIKEYEQIKKECNSSTISTFLNFINRFHHWLIPYHYTDTTTYWYLNPLPIIRKGEMSR